MSDDRETRPIFLIAKQIDDVLNSVVGIAPLTPLVKAGREFAPANLIKSVTGIKKPSEVVNPMIEDAVDKIKSGAPPLPGPLSGTR